MLASEGKTMGSILETTAAVAPGDDGARKARILAALTAYARQRPGFDPRNYGDRASYDADRRTSLRQLHDVERLASAVAWRSIGPDALIQAARGTRVGITEDGVGGVRVDYCAGQYFPTEYRAGVARVLASALWDYTRDYAMPTAVGHRVRYGDGTESGMLGLHAAMAIASEARSSHVVDYYRASPGGSMLRAGDWLRRYFAREFGRGMASRYFN
jgi:hypothetical protein